MEGIGQNVFRRRADIGTCVVRNVALNREACAVAADAAAALKNALDGAMHARPLDPTDVVALIAAGEPDDLCIANGAFHVAAIRGIAIGDHIRLRRINAVQIHEDRIESLVPRGADDDDIELRVAARAAADRVDHRLQSRRLSAAARQIQNRAVKFRMNVSRIPGEINRQCGNDDHLRYLARNS
jgi:hypothetical protein